MKNYDPNIRFAEYTTEITYQSWRYVYKQEVKVKGNVKGFDVLKYAIERHAEMIYSALDENPKLELTFVDPDDKEETLLCGVADGASDGWSEEIDVEDWLSKMCVSLKIVNVEDYK